MLNYETLLSSYDDKLTLMQWLKKVEEALKDASATSFDVIKTGDATLKFAITFEDGTSLVSGEIVLQQGESVASGEIRNGHLFLTLTNGQELDCGTLFNGEIPNMQVRALEVTGGLIVGDDANAAIGGDLVVHGLTEVQNLLAYGHIETETLTATGDKITAEKPVIETMAGYYANIVQNQGLTIENVYTSAVKNGNKLTLVSAMNITRTEELSTASRNFLRFYIPTAVANKLYNSQIGTYNALDWSIKSFFDESGNSVNLGILIEKYSTNYILVYIQGGYISTLPLNKKVYVRIEQTYLLSDDIILP